MLKVVFISTIVATAVSLAPTSPNVPSQSGSEQGHGSLVSRSTTSDPELDWRSGDRVSAKSLPFDQVTAISKNIDSLVDVKLKENNQRRNPPVDDATFLRRIYLDIAGRIPNYEETQAFLDSKKPNKRAVLIDELLDSYGRVSHQFNFWADLLRIKSKHRNITGQPYIDYVKDSLESNKPYDQLVRELITAGGPLMQRDNGAVGYYLRDRQMPEDNMSNTIRVFLGTRLECAQCHDHPFDDWTQRQYFEMVAFTGGIAFKLPEIDSQHQADFKKFKKSREQNKIDYDLRVAVKRIVEPMTYGIAGTGTGLARLPENYMGDDGEDYDIVKAKTMFEGKTLVDPEMPASKNRNRKRNSNKKNKHLVLGAKEIDSREAYAEWLTEPENPRFTMVMANRLWKQAMGMGLIEPVDDMTKHSRASNPELMTYLTVIFEELDYDMKQFQRALFNSRTYQSRAMREDILDPGKFYFNGPVVRRMAAEQIWDSLLTLVVSDVDQRSAPEIKSRYGGLGESGDIYEQYEKLRELAPAEIIAKAKSLMNSRGKGKKAQMDMMRGKQKNAQQISNEVKRLNKLIAKADRDGNKSEMASLMKQKNRLTDKLRKNPKMAERFSRASEIQSPARPGHFLREFGQSDRETIDNAVVDPAVTQALSLMNGSLDRVINNPSTVLMQNVASAESEEAIKIVFLSMLNRNPHAHEIALWTRDFRSESKRVVLRDLIWTLANSNEFIFIK